MQDLISRLNTVPVSRNQGIVPSDIKFMRTARAADRGASELPCTKGLIDMGRLILQCIAEYTCNGIAVSDPSVRVSKPSLESYVTVGVDGLEGSSSHWRKVPERG